MKKILIGAVILVSVFLIYLGFKDNDIYYVSLGDSLANGLNSYNQEDYGYSDYIKDYLKDNNKLENYVKVVDNDKRTIDISRDIKDNISINVDGKKKTLQNALIKADLITISVGTNDFLNNLNLNDDFSINDLYDKLQQVIDDFEEMFKLLRQYCKEEIVFIGFYNFTDEPNLDDFFAYANKLISDLASSYNIKFLNIFDDFKNNQYFINPKDKFPNKNGYNLIANKVINLIDLKNN